MTCAWWDMRVVPLFVGALAARRAGIERDADADTRVLRSVQPAVRVLAAMRVLQCALLLCSGCGEGRGALPCHWHWAIATSRSGYLGLGGCVFDELMVKLVFKCDGPSDPAYGRVVCCVAGQEVSPWAGVVHMPFGPTARLVPAYGCVVWCS